MNKIKKSNEIIGENCRSGILDLTKYEDNVRESKDILQIELYKSSNF
jgi:hypothetical protein